MGGQRMTLDMKQIQKRADITYRKFRDTTGVNRDDALKVKVFLDSFMDDLKYFDERMGKNDKEIKPEEDNTSNQIKMIKSLRMNNPLWDVE